MLNLIRFIKGYVIIKVYGYSPERFMNLCSNRNILLWGVTRYPEYYIMHISVKGFFQLRTIAHKTKTKVVIIQKYGLPFLIPKIRKRALFLGGVICCLGFLLLMMNYIWAIDIQGNVSITREEIMDYLQENEIHYGTFKHLIQPEELKKNIRVNFTNVIWDSVKIEGTKLTIEIKEGIGLKNEKSSSEAVTKAPSDIIAEKKGTIVNIVTRKGTPKVKINDSVSQNQILVSGLIPITGEDGETQKYNYCSADADIYIRSQYPYEDHIENTYMKRVYEEDYESIYILSIMGKELEIPHGKITKKQYEIFTDQRQLKLFKDFYLPASIECRKIYGYELQKNTYTDSQMKRLGEIHLDEFLESLKEKGVQIIRKDVKINRMKSNAINSNTKKSNAVNSNDKKGMLIEGWITVIEKTGKQVPSAY